MGKKRRSTKTAINLGELIISGLIDLVVGVIITLMAKWL